MLYLEANCAIAKHKQIVQWQKTIFWRKLCQQLDYVSITRVCYNGLTPHIGAEGDSPHSNATCVLYSQYSQPLHFLILTEILYVAENKTNVSLELFQIEFMQEVSLGKLFKTKYFEYCKPETLCMIICLLFHNFWTCNSVYARFC